MATSEPNLDIDVEEGKLPCVICRPELDHNGMPCWNCWCVTRANAEKLEKLCEALDDIEWVEDVDVNGEYTTRRWRPGMEIKSKVTRLVASAREKL